MDIDYLGWIPEDCHLDENRAWIVEKYLLKSLAVGASKRSRGFIDELEIRHSSSAEALLKRLESDDFRFDFKNNAHEVESYVVELEGLPWELGEYYVCTRSDKKALIDAVSELDEYIAVDSSSLADEGLPQIKERFREVDAVFRHLRNAIAHGCFRYEAGDQPALFSLTSINKAIFQQ